MAKKVANHREDALYSQIASILEQNRKSIAVAVNTAMVRTYYEIGRSIVENEQKGSVRAEYGKEVLKNLSARLCQSGSNETSNKSVNMAGSLDFIGFACLI